MEPLNKKPSDVSIQFLFYLLKPSQSWHTFLKGDAVSIPALSNIWSKDWFDPVIPNKIWDLFVVSRIVVVDKLGSGSEMFWEREFDSLWVSSVLAVWCATKRDYSGYSPQGMHAKGWNKCIVSIVHVIINEDKVISSFLIRNI